MRSRLYYHIVWTTRDRRPVLDRPAVEFLGALPAGCGAAIHVLVTAETMTVLPRLAQRFKGGSSVLINREGHTSRNIPVRWEKGNRAPG
jgi:REP element-mobilizing transposase RayT